MSNGVRQRFIWVGLIAAVFGLATPALVPEAAAQETRVRLEVPSGNIQPGGPPFAVDVVVENATNLGAFEFTLTYDSSILGYVNVQNGPFLASSGRKVQCLDPRVTPGSIRFVCVTLGALPPGADGSGVLASITFAPNTQGSSALQLAGLILARPDGQAVPAASEGASITVALPGAPEAPTPTASTPLPTPAAQVTPLATASPASTLVGATPTGAARVGPTPTQAGTPTTTDASSDGGTNWPLWGSVIGVAAALVVAAGLFGWLRLWKPS